MKKQLVIDNIKTCYEIDSDGTIYNTETQKELTGSIYNTGYRMVRLTVNGKGKGYAVHRLVAQTFLENPENLPIVNHKDGDKTNNKIENLEWVTQSQNRKHAVKELKTGLAYGERKKVNISEEDPFWKRYKDTNYLVSKDGQVYNTKTRILLKQTPNQGGYIRYTLRINNKNCSKQAHILVLETWTDQDLTGKVVNHKDGNKSNNNISNLQAVSKSENAKHAIYQLDKIGKHVLEIFNDGTTKEYQSIMQAAREKQVTQGAIRYALKNETRCCGHYWQYK